MKEKKIAKEMKKTIELIKQSRERLLSKTEPLKPFEEGDLRDFNEAIHYMSYVHNYFSKPSKHI